MKTINHTYNDQVIEDRIFSIERVDYYVDTKYGKTILKVIDPAVSPNKGEYVVISGVKYKVVNIILHVENAELYHYLEEI